MFFDELRSNINQEAFSSQQVLESGMKEDGGEIDWAETSIASSRTERTWLVTDRAIPYKTKSL